MITSLWWADSDLLFDDRVSIKEKQIRNMSHCSLCSSNNLKRNKWVEKFCVFISWYVELWSVGWLACNTRNQPLQWTFCLQYQWHHWANTSPTANYIKGNYLDPAIGQKQAGDRTDKRGRRAECTTLSFIMQEDVTCMRVLLLLLLGDKLLKTTASQAHFSQRRDLDGAFV